MWLMRMGVTPRAFASAAWVRPSGSMKSWSRISPGWTGGSFFLVFIDSMIIDNFHVVCVLASPAEAKPVLVVDPDAVLSDPVAFEGFQAVARRQLQVAQLPGTVQLRELA